MGYDGNGLVGKRKEGISKPIQPPSQLPKDKSGLGYGQNTIDSQEEALSHSQQEQEYERKQEERAIQREEEFACKQQEEAIHKQQQEAARRQQKEAEELAKKREEATNNLYEQIFRLQASSETYSNEWE
ncbi:vicilin-like seed storage protein At2g18540 [Cryptomeria japonica]|uniref:vicilin-like seed storage protein At2g18540 n=1 Tax=Cryptomeria japonica TaxID=3369 RepID=UPI0027DA4F30|nr:vicilin-like seed storage protein At2g18540 [Cryptomeria japonica]